MIEGPAVSPPPEEQKRLTVLVTPVITSSFSLAKIFTVPPGNNSIVSDSQDVNLKVSFAAFSLISLNFNSYFSIILDWYLKICHPSKCKSQ